MSKFMSGSQLCKKLKLQPIELLHFISETGLQPLSTTGQPIRPPDVDKIKRAMMSINLDNSTLSGGCIGLKDSYVSLDEIKEQRGDLVSWRGFDFGNCVGGLIFFENEKVDIIKRLASDEVLFLSVDVNEKFKSSKKKRPTPTFTKRNQKSKLICQNYAYEQWWVNKRRLTKNEMIKEIQDKKLVFKKIAEDGKKCPLEDGTIDGYLSGIKTGLKKPPFPC